MLSQYHKLKGHCNNRLLFTYGFVKSFATSKKVTSYIVQWSDPRYRSAFKEWVILRPLSALIGFGSLVSPSTWFVTVCSEICFDN
jgi:hypothetical protein